MNEKGISITGETLIDSDYRGDVGNVFSCPFLFNKKQQV